MIAVTIVLAAALLDGFYGPRDIKSPDPNCEHCFGTGHIKWLNYDGREEEEECSCTNNKPKIK